MSGEGVGSSSAELGETIWERLSDSGALLPSESPV